MIEELNGKVIEFGGGSRPQFHPNLDVRPGPGVDIVANLEEPLPVEDMTYDAAWCQYCIEHISWRKVKGFLKEVARILKPEGKFVVITANLKEQSKVVANKDWGDSKDEFYESRMIFGDQDYSDNTHKVGMSPELAVKWFKEAGFGVVKVEPHPNCPTDMIIKATKVAPVIDRLNWIMNETIRLSKPESKIVDIGCSDCPMTYLLTNCTWVDTVSYDKVVADMKHFGRQPIPKEKFVRASAEDLPFENKKFDIALITELLEHVSDPVDILREVNRVAKHVIITVPNEYSWDIKWNPFHNTSHVRHYTENMLKQHLKEAKITDYKLGRLDYEGWSFFTVTANLSEVSVAKKKYSTVFDNPSYWCGSLGYRSDSFGGYRDFPVNGVKVDYVMSKNPEKVLDIGCAMGYIVKRLRDKKVDAWGIDISKYAIDHAPDEVKSFLKCGSANKLPWDDKSFDMVVSFSTLEHLSKDILTEAISEIKRVTKRGIISVGLSTDKSFDEDMTHQTKESLSWWRSQFPPEFEVRSDADEEWKISGGKLKVALLSTPFLTVPPKNYGGLERIVADSAYCMAKDGHQVTVFCPNGSQVEGCEMVYFGEPMDSVHCNWLDEERKVINIVADRILSNGFQIVHGHNWFGFEYALKVRKPELKACHTHHGGLDTNWWTKPPFNLNMISISNWMQSVYSNQGITSRVVYNGIPIEEYPFQEKKGDRLLFVGRLDSFKQPHIAIEVAKKTGLGLDIAGGSFVQDVAYMESIKQACDGKQIKLYLDADMKTKVPLYQDAKAVIFPSKMGEPFGLITPESNACGTPVIASRDGAIPEVLQDGVSGFICNDVDQMVEAVKKIDTIKPQDCRKNAERFSRENMAKNYIEFYTGILKGSEW